MDKINLPHHSCVLSLSNVNGMVFVPKSIENITNNGTNIILSIKVIGDDSKSLRKLRVSPSVLTDIECILSEDNSSYIKYKNHEISSVHSMCFMRPEISLDDGPNQCGWFDNLRNLPTIIKGLVDDVRFIAESARYKPTHSVSNNLRRDHTDFLRSKLQVSSDQVEQLQSENRRLTNKVIRSKSRLLNSYERYHKENNELRSEIITLKNTLSNREEDVLREAEKIRARLALEAKQEMQMD